MALVPSATSTPSLSALLESVLAERNVPVTDRVRRAMNSADGLYRGQVHWTGITLSEHVAGVLTSFLRFPVDEDGCIACILHHVLDVKGMTLAELESRFGKTVRGLVSGIHLLSHVTKKNKRMSLENLRMMFLRVSDDPRIVLVILSDQVEVLRHLERLPVALQRRTCHDALDLFSPVAARLGIYALKQLIEQRAFPVVYPTDALRIGEQLEMLHAQHGDFLTQAGQLLTEFLASEGVSTRIEGREKQPYSIFGKMGNKAMTHVSHLYDLFALRVIVADEAACYQALGLLHRIGHPVSNRFKDYIAFPKPNGYQSLHTTLAHLPGVPDGIFVEVQIRTETMHRAAEYGIAAHWNYKEGGAAQIAARRIYTNKALAVQSVGDDGAQESTPFTDHIFVLTPKGDVIELPEGSTPLDFAFSVHTDLGIAYKAARVNGSIVPLDYALENGDVVEILKHSDPRPSPQWLQLLRTAPARTRLKRYLAARERIPFINAGKDLLNAELRKRKRLPLDPDLSMLRIVDGRKLPVAEREEILLQIGQGTVKAASVLPRLAALAQEPSAPVVTRTANKPVKGSGGPAVSLESDIRMPIRFARCCKPLEGKRGPILGIVSRSGDVRVHKAECRMTKSVNPERRMKVKWMS